MYCGYYILYSKTRYCIKWRWKCNDDNKEAWRKTSAKLNSGIIHSIHSSVHISRERILKTIKQQLFFFLDEQFYFDQYAIGSK